MDKKIKITVAGTGYVGLSIATLLSQHHEVWAVDIIEEKVSLINSKKSPIQDEYIEISCRKRTRFNSNNKSRASIYECGFCCHSNANKLRQRKKLL